MGSINDDTDFNMQRKTSMCCHLCQTLNLHASQRKRTVTVGPLSNNLFLVSGKKKVGLVHATQRDGPHLQVTRCRPFASSVNLRFQEIMKHEFNTKMRLEYAPCSPEKPEGVLVVLVMTCMTGHRHRSLLMPWQGKYIQIVASARFDLGS